MRVISRYNSFRGEDLASHFHISLSSFDRFLALRYSIHSFRRLTQMRRNSIWMIAAVALLGCKLAQSISTTPTQASKMASPPSQRQPSPGQQQPLNGSSVNNAPAPVTNIYALSGHGDRVTDIKSGFLSRRRFVERVIWYRAPRNAPTLIGCCQRRQETSAREINARSEVYGR
jgi:hypothetical protein